MRLKRNFTFEPFFFVNYELRIINYELRITDYQLRIINYELQFAKKLINLYSNFYGFFLFLRDRRILPLLE